MLPNPSTSTSLFTIENVFVFLSEINKKLDDVIPRVVTIENKLKDMDKLYHDIDQVKMCSSEIIGEIRGSALSLKSISSTVRSVSESSDSTTDTSDLSGSISLHQTEEVVTDQCSVKHGLVMSDSDMSELTASTGQMLGCQVAMYNYSGGQVEPTMFQENLEFVLIQDSGKLDRYEELTNETIKEMTAYVQELVKLSSNILMLQPATKVFLGSLPPRYDGRRMAELTRVFNSLLLTQSIHEERITVVTQSQLSCVYNRKKSERFKRDLVTLTRYGQRLRDKNIATQISETIPELKLIKKKKKRPPVQPWHDLDRWQISPS